MYCPHWIATGAVSPSGGDDGSDLVVRASDGFVDQAAFAFRAATQRMIFAASAALAAAGQRRMMIEPGDFHTWGGIEKPMETAGVICGKVRGELL
ncbi:MAG TPA: hypothetical protein VFA65_14720 [Bryobacteraceae bacterium]|nr:hypothetical protein [Bryobacteraceae bacterium]